MRNKTRMIACILTGVLLLQSATPVYAMDIFTEVDSTDSYSSEESMLLPEFSDALDIFSDIDVSVPDSIDIFQDLDPEMNESVSAIEDFASDVFSEVFSPVILSGEIYAGTVRVPVPENWIGKVELIEEEGCYWFVHIASREAGVSGKLFGLLPNGSGYGTRVVGEDGTEYLWVDAPEELPEDTDLAFEYWDLLEGLGMIRSSLTIAEPFSEIVATAEDLADLVPKYYEKYFTPETAAMVSEAIERYETGEGTREEVAEAVSQLKYITAEVPQIYITTQDENGNNIEKADGYVPTHIAIVSPDGSVTKSGDMDALIKVRGNSTSLGAKKPFNIKFSGKTNVLGMGKAKKWALLANHYDPTMMRNYLMLKTAKKIGLAYTSECEFAELWVDGVFKGCYLVAESVEAGETRVNINKQKGDFLLEWKKAQVEEGVEYLNVPGAEWRFEYSDPDEPTAEQKAHAETVMSSVYKALVSGDFQQVSQYLDLDSFVKYYLLNEWAKTADFSDQSVYFYWKDGKLYAGPSWDFDICTGNVNIYGDQPEGWYCTTANIYRHLNMYPEFTKKIRLAYRELKPIFDSVWTSGGMIDQVMQDVYPVFLRNETKAGWDPGKVVYPYMRIPDPTFDENVRYLSNWLNKRTEWMDSRLFIDTDSILDQDIFYEESGVPKVGWRVYNKTWYYFDTNGKPVTGFQKIGTKIYYFDFECRMLTGWLAIGENWYYFNTSGQQVYGLQKIDGSYYSFASETGIRQSGWRLYNNSWYFFGTDGKAVTGIQKIGTKIYYFDSECRMLTGWQAINGNWYYFNTSGQQVYGLQKIDGFYYSFVSETGVRQSGWRLYNDIWYFFGTDGKAVAGLQKIGTKIYYFDSECRMQTGWQAINGNWYYFNTSGQQVYGLQKIDGFYYSFVSETGVCQSGWRLYNDIWYFFGTDGKAVTGFQKIGTKTYYFDSECRMLSGWQTIDGKKYYFNEKGQLMENI